MPRPSRPARLALLGRVILAWGSPRGLAQAPPVENPPAPPPQAVPAPDEGAKAIVPSPPAAIPDDPPPHEGAMIDVPLVIEPPDIIIVEVLEALPGRPITGERLVRPDGMVSLGFYGEVNVRGLTCEQAKVKIILHMRSFLTDDVLGLKLVMAPGGGEIEPLPKPGTRVPIEMEIEPDNRPFEKPDVQPMPEPPAPAQPPVEGNLPRPSASRPGAHLRATSGPRAVRGGRRTPPLARFVKQDRDPVQEPMNKPGDQPEQVFADEAVYIDPAKSLRVFVDIVSFNSKVYFVQGDVGTPGRLPCTGKETILDAMNYAGGLVPSAEPADIHLYRPARGGKPARDYPVDFAAIQRGEARANLQIFPDDRLVVGRNAIVKKTIEIDRAAAPLNSVFNAALQQSFAQRSLGAATGSINSTDDRRRDLLLQRWFDFLWSLPVNKPQELDAGKLLDAIRSRLDPPADARPAPK